MAPALVRSAAMVTSAASNGVIDNRSPNSAAQTWLEVGLGLDTGTSVSPGSGAQFAILPPQNASGNWVKVVHPVVDIEISSEIVASPDFAPYLSFELIYTVAG